VTRPNRFNAQSQIKHCTRVYALIFTIGQQQLLRARPCFRMDKRVLHRHNVALIWVLLAIRQLPIHVFVTIRHTIGQQQIHVVILLF